MTNLARLAYIRRFAEDYLHCFKLIGSPLAAYGYLRSGRQPEIGSFQLGLCKFQARKEDWVAVKEVLVQDEYACIDTLLAGLATPRVIDLGANIGSFALRVFLFSAQARVASVEAAPDTFNVLATNRSLNPFFDWHLFNNGIWRHDEPLTLMRRGISVGHRVIENGEGDIVQGITLHSLLDQLKWDAVDLIKMDIEGGEEAVVPVALDIFRKTRYLIIEVHTDRINAEPVMEALHSVYSYIQQLNDRTSNKPVYIMAHTPLPFGAQS
jgi:FkbM family methyltransferase